MISRVTAADQVYRLLRDRIVRRVIAPGDRVHVGGLAEELGVSRTPIKNALTRLQSEGLISVIPQRGTFVNSPSAKEFLDLLDVRLGLELWGARKSIEKLNEADLETLKDLHDRMVASVARLEEKPYEGYLSFIDLNREFHGAIVRSSGNAKLLGIYRMIDMAAQIQRVVFPLPKEIFTRGNKEHAQILKALRKRDWPRVEHAITTHLEALKQDVLQRLESLPEKNHA